MNERGRSLSEHRQLREACRQLIDNASKKQIVDRFAEMVAVNVELQQQLAEQQQRVQQL